MTWILNHLLWIPWILIIFLLGYSLNYIHRGEKWQNERDMRRATDYYDKIFKIIQGEHLTNGVFCGIID